MTSDRTRTVRRTKAAVVGLGAFAALGSAIAIGAATSTGGTADSAHQGQGGPGRPTVHRVLTVGDDQGERGEGAGLAQQTRQVRQAPPGGGLQPGRAPSQGSSHTISSGS